jgi:hypothetical protein
MKLSDIMSSMQLSGYAEVAMLLFMGAFLAVSISLLRNRDSEEWERCRHLPLDREGDASPATRPPAP